MEHTYIPAATLTPTVRAPEPRPLPASTTPRFIDDVAAGRVELPTIPKVVQRVIAALRDPNSDSRKIGEALAQDPVISAKVLRVANSSFFGGQRSMASIDAAIATIGTQALDRLIVACGVSSTFQQVPGIELPVFWRDAQVAATAANKLAQRLGADAEEAYLCGLLHASGHLILCQTYPEIAEAMFSGFPVVRGAELAAIELDAFGIDHPTVGALWVESLGFPQSVADTIRAAVGAASASESAAVSALRSACLLVKAVAVQASPQVAVAELPPKVRAVLIDAAGEPDAAFCALYEALLATESNV